MRKKANQETSKGKKKSGFRPLYRTQLGRMFVGKVEDVLPSAKLEKIRGKVDLVFTSPPFPLVRKKRYGNETGDAYLKWLEGLAPQLSALLSDTGSIVMEVGNSWVSGEPEMSTLNLESLLAFKRAAKLHLCQQIICHNPARLPSPAQWVNVERIRLKDSFTHIWWMSRTARPKANNKNVLIPYSEHMKSLLRRQTYNSGVRPSGHRISVSGFKMDRGGAIAPSVLRVDEPEEVAADGMLEFSGTSADLQYREYCKQQQIAMHPARMQMGLASFFIKFLTNKDDLVFDPFAGSNTTGAAAERLKRRWLSVEANAEYAQGSQGRFSKVTEGAKLGGKT